MNPMDLIEVGLNASIQTWFYNINTRKYTRHSMSLNYRVNFIFKKHISTVQVKKYNQF